ncbi:MAG: ABC transporter ATP-binding protein, partial [Gordonia sp.]|nr:ABC transporter ATP-binding protein [Gordonia sp. (in: high G+C Gram-positive bacteria)]
AAAATTQAAVPLGKASADYAGDDAVTQSWAVAPGLVDGPTAEFEVPNEGGRHSSTENPDNRS